MNKLKVYLHKGVTFSRKREASLAFEISKIFGNQRLFRLRRNEEMTVFDTCYRANDIAIAAFSNEQRYRSGVWVCDYGSNEASRVYASDSAADVAWSTLIFVRGSALHPPLTASHAGHDISMMIFSAKLWYPPVGLPASNSADSSKLRTFRTWNLCNINVTPYLSFVTS